MSVMTMMRVAKDVTEQHLESIRSHMERLMGIPVGIATQDVYPLRAVMFARGYSVSSTSIDDESAEDTAARLARAIWMAALSDEPGAFSSEGP